MDGAHEEARRRARIGDGDDAGRGGAAKVVLDDGDPAARRTVFALRQSPRVHKDDDVLREDALRERDELFGDVAENLARIRCGRIDRRQLQDERRRRDGKMHRFREERALGAGVTQHRGRGDLQLCGDVGERRALEALRGEDPSRNGEELIAGDGRRTAHL